jgi:hypothetical protein
VINKITKLDSTQIKIIAIVLMFADHIHQMFLPLGAPIWLTWLGRPVFPLFLFCAAEAFHYTHSRKKYLIRLFAASCCMTVLTFGTQLVLPNDDVVLMNNAFSTFLIAGLYMWFWDIFIDGVKNRKPKKIIGGILLCFVPILTAIPVLTVFNLPMQNFTLKRILLLLTMMLPNVTSIEGGIIMAGIGILFYIFRKWRWAQAAVLAAVSASAFIRGGDASNQWLMILAVIPMLLYNGKPGRGMKRFFYIFYPAHIIILYAAATLMLG